MATDFGNVRDEIVPLVTQITDDLKQGAIDAFRETFLGLHNYDQAQIYLNLTPQLRQQVIEWLTLDELANVFDHLDSDEVDVNHLLEEMSPSYAANMLNEMYVDNAVDVLDEISEPEQDIYLKQMSREDAGELRHLLDYDEDTAGALMTTEYIEVSQTSTIGQVMSLVKKAASESEQISYIYVLERKRLIGVISLRNLIIHPDDELVSEVMTSNLVTVLPTEDQEQVARLMADYNLLAMPVVDEQNEMLGIIMVDDIVDVIEAESTEDYGRLAGVNDLDLEESPMMSVIKRIPWLIILVFLGLGTASIINSYDAMVQQASVLAVFISLITGTAGNAGTQALAVSIRRITLDEKRSVIRMFFTELFIGALIGLIAGTTIFGVVWLWKSNVLLGLAVGLAMAIAIMVANLAGAFIPIIMDAMHVDPAVASGPFISTLSDLTSVIIYFNIAGVFITHFIGH
ncbi:magnesium transporter [Weissella diestrammenae]|uniref:Magnesium transporter MgtE n=1 Tax=Weissella diestrammenae TaxID=1162633 RepID=A0A7G9T4C4_9LACO|nr:magnesium transporter [Weissella diestrammenae]MCM0583485.1 magnesium transporter [Weissella diestrammenae]QNN74949.1 magnesium transporter [Weissella diestrammenae]